MELTRSCSTLSDTETEVPLNIYIGTTFRITVTFYEDDGITPVDLTLYDIEFHVVDSSNLPIISLSSNSITTNGSTIIFVDAINGIADILITDEETTLLSRLKGYWWMTLNPPNGDKLPRGRGEIFIKYPYE